MTPLVEIETFGCVERDPLENGFQRLDQIFIFQCLLHLVNPYYLKIKMGK